MNNKFDELTKGLAQSTTRRGALKKFSLGLAGIALAALGLANNAEANGGTSGCFHKCRNRCKRSNDPACINTCIELCKNNI